jgi:hypothetical protein
LYDTFGVCQDFVVPEPKHAPTFAFQERSPAPISLTTRMLRAIGLDYQAVLRAGEIDDEFAYRVLPTKPVTRQTPITQDRP